MTVVADHGTDVLLFIHRHGYSDHFGSYMKKDISIEGSVEHVEDL